jgi:signal transduction histidine kinase
LQKLHLNIARGPGKGKSLDLPEDRAFSIGRGHSNDLTLADRLISSHHARIEMDGGYFVLTDLNSKNHTYVNGTAITSPVVLRDRDQVGIGNCVLAVKATEAPAVTLSDKPDQRKEQAVIETTKTMAVDASTIKTAITALGRSEKNLAVLHTVTKMLAASREPGLFLPQLLDLMFEVVPADRGVVFIVEDGDTRPLHARDSKGEILKNLSISRSVLRRAVDEGVCILTGHDKGFDSQESIVLHQIQSAMCAPIRGQDKVLGAIYLDSKITGKSFDDEDLELLTTVSTHAGMAYDNHRLATESARAERMAAIGLLVAGLAHDIKNYMLGLTLGQGLIEPEIRERCSPDGNTAWNAMKDSQGRIMDLVQDMLAFSKPREPEWKLVDPNQVASEAVSALTNRAEEAGVLLEFKRHPKLGPSWLDPKAMERGLVNLAGNAIDATEGGGTVTVRVAKGEDGNGLEFHVADTGTGIPPDARPHVFDLFFSTKQSKGTGLGLAVTKKMVEEHSGTITFTTEVNEGTTFVIAVPVHEQRPEARITPSGTQVLR